MLWLKFLITCRPCGDPAAGMWRSQDTPGVGRPALGTSPWLGSCGEASSISNSVHHLWTCNQQGRKSRRGTSSCFVSLCVSTSVGRDRAGRAPALPEQDRDHSPAPASGCPPLAPQGDTGSSSPARGSRVQSCAPCPGAQQGADEPKGRENVSCPVVGMHRARSKPPCPCRMASSWHTLNCARFPFEDSEIQQPVPGRHQLQTPLILCWPEPGPALSFSWLSDSQVIPSSSWAPLLSVYLLQKAKAALLAAGEELAECCLCEPSDLWDCL